MVLFVALVAAFLAVFNNLANWRPWPAWTYIPVNVGVAVLLVLLARLRGIRWDELGLAREALWPGLRVGGLIAAAIAVGLAIAFVIPVADRFLSDRRVAGFDESALVYTALLRIPLGTALLEEVAFRGVLYGAWLRIGSPLQAAIGSSLIFGLWHIVPTLELLKTNDWARGSPSTTVALVVLGVIATAIAGMLFVGLREWTRGLVGPILVHAATNSFATVAAYVWQKS